jgi:hypothetical protein
MKKLIYLIILSLILYGCGDIKESLKGDKGKDGTTTTVYVDQTTDTTTDTEDAGSVDTTEIAGTNTEDEGTVDDTGTPTDPTPYALINPSGKAEAGPCYLLSDVSAMGMNASWIQDGYVLGEMQKNDGTFGVPGAYSTLYVVYDFGGTCYSEGDNTDVTGIRMKMGQSSSASSHNINHATTWRYHLAKRYFENPDHPNYEDAAGAFAQAKIDIYSFLNFSSSINFYELSITGQTTGDAYLLAFESAVTKGRNGPEQNDYIGQAVNAVIEEDTTFRDNLRNTVLNLPIYEIYQNLDNKLTSLGFDNVDPAPIFNLSIYPGYYAEILNRTPTILEWINQSATSTILFDTTGYNSFAYPTIFTNIENPGKYLATELDGSLSIWSSGTCNQGTDYQCPLTELVTIEELNEILLEPAMNYNGLLGEHGLTNGTQYFIVQEFDDYVHQPSHASDGDMLPFGRNLAAIDNNWNASVGWDNTTTWFRRSPKIFITD